MSRIALVAAAITLAFAVQPAMAQDEQAARDNIESIHGDADGFFETLGALQNALSLDDMAAVAELVWFPVMVSADDAAYDVDDAEALLDDIDRLLPAENRQLLLDQDPADLIVTSEGVGLGNGAVWLTNVCLDDDCAETQWGIIAING